MNKSMDTSFGQSIEILCRARAGLAYEAVNLVDREGAGVTSGPTPGQMTGL